MAASRKVCEAQIKIPPGGAPSPTTQTNALKFPGAASLRYLKRADLDESTRKSLVSPLRDYDLGLVRNNQVHMMMTADAATINSAQINVT